ncbi:MAG: Dimethyladenosine transferase [Cyphobasidiales sp. Tagirdzhanova-0007]|nr:MAG: Dimethyladenosine transferase [Cyphobasidiales sp. Tagirdzhanova-0007]
MPRAVSAKLSRVRQPAADAKTRNPLFNTQAYGQHILVNPGVCQAIVEKANIKPHEKLLEVGPGTGNLSVLILQKCKSLLAVEMDPRMAAELQKRVQGKPEQRKLEVVVGDFVKADLPHFDVCISNTPYQISSPLVFKLLSQRPLPRVCILMFQREFALRLVARPGDNLWNRLSANAQLFAKIDHVLKVSKNSFRPPPNVESSVVRIVPIDPPPPVRFEEFDGLTRILFQRRNKTVRANFQAKGVKDMLEANYKAWLSSRPQPLVRVQAGDHVLADDVMGEGNDGVALVLEQILQDSGFSDRRPAKMDVDDFLSLLARFHSHGFHFGG